MMPGTERISELFATAFLATENTILVGGAAEPFYLPAANGLPAKIFYRDDYLRSALHEVAHWCVAGSHRRQLADYGYWYSPDGRDMNAQQAFFAVEAKPQAIEKHFCAALGVPFSPSIDNLNLDIPSADLAAFGARLQAWYEHYAAQGLPDRAARFAQLLGRQSNDAAA